MIRYFILIMVIIYIIGKWWHNRMGKR